MAGEFGLAFASHMIYADLQSTGSAGERTGYACGLFSFLLVKKTVDDCEGDAVMHVGFCPSIWRVCMKPRSRGETMLRPFWSSRNDFRERDGLGDGLRL